MQFGRNNTAFDKAEFAARLARTKARMAAADLEVLIVCDPANMNYLTGYDGWSFYVHQAVLVALDLDRPLWFGRGQDVNGARLTTILPDADITGYSDDHVQSTTKHPMQALSRLIEARGLAAKRIGVEADSYYFTAKSLEVLRRELPNARFEDAGVLVNWVRAVKSPAEIALMIQAARIAEITMRKAIEMIGVGVRQCDLARSEEHTSELQSPDHLVCRLLLEKVSVHHSDLHSFPTRRSSDLAAPRAAECPLRGCRRAGQLGPRGQVSGRDRAHDPGGSHRRNHHAQGDRDDRGRRAPVRPGEIGRAHV